MAEVWFDILAKLSKHEVEKLKNELDNLTLVGEYIGSQEHQHLVKYSRVTLIFYAIVPKDSETTCIPCHKATQFFEKYKLDFVNF